MTAVNKLPCQVNKTDVFALNVSSWANGEALTNYSVTNADSKISIGAVSEENSVIMFFATGVEEGTASALIEWSTATRSRSEVMTISVVSVSL